MNIFPYKMGSKSAKALAQALGIKQIKREGSKFKGSPAKTVINWGCSALPAELLKCRVLNSPVAVSKAANKLSCFKAMAEAGVSIPRFFDNAVGASELVQDGKTVVVRHKLTGHSGEGIEIVEAGQDAVLPVAPLYVEYIPKKHEYRIHVFQGDVVDVQRKARAKDVPDDEVNWKIRNHKNGFIFARGEEALGDVPEDVLDQAKQAVAAVGLDFGAVDVVFNEKQKKAFVLEINTACGLSGTTLAGYVERFKGVQ